MGSVRLKSRCGIRVKMLPLVHPETVERARAYVCRPRKISAFLWLERQKGAVRIWVGPLLQNEINPLAFWRPKPEMRFIRADQLGADRITAFRFHFDSSRTGPALVRFACAGLDSN